MAAPLGPAPVTVAGADRRGGHRCRPHGRCCTQEEGEVHDALTGARRGLFGRGLRQRGAAREAGTAVLWWEEAGSTLAER